MLGGDAPTAGRPDARDLSLEPGDCGDAFQPETTSDASYHLSLQRADPFVEPGASPPSLPVSLTLTPSVTEVAGYVATGQHVDAPLSIGNTGTTDLTLTLDAVTSQQAWSATPARRR